MADADVSQNELLPTTDEIFADLLNETFGKDQRLQGRVVNGTVLAVENATTNSPLLPVLGVPVRDNPCVARLASCNN